MLYALVIYPVLGLLAGHRYPSAPTFGLPCPTTIFTFGVLLLAREKLPRFLFAIPMVWALIGFTAAFAFGVYEDYGLLIAGLALIVLALLKNKKTTLKVISSSTQ
jgi:hypothetical protein